MDRTLSTLDEASRRTVEALMEVVRRIDGRGVGALFEEEGRFTGALSGGVFKGRGVIESHFIQVFKRLPKGPVRIDRVQVEGERVTFDWRIEDPEGVAISPIPARYTLVLGRDGLIASLLAEWDAKILSRPQAPAKPMARRL
jgi:hypothetical protein